MKPGDKTAACPNEKARCHRLALERVQLFRMLSFFLLLAFSSLCCFSSFSPVELFLSVSVCSCRSLAAQTQELESKARTSSNRKASNEFKSIAAQQNSLLFFFCTLERLKLVRSLWPAGRMGFISDQLSPSSSPLVAHFKDTGDI